MSRLQNVRPSRAMIHCGIVGLLLTPPLEARSYAAFSQLTCSSSSWGTPVPTQIGAKEFVKKTTNPGGSGDMTLYNVNTDSLTPSVLTNSNVQYLQPYLGYFVTESGYDALAVYPNSNGPYYYSGSLNASMLSYSNTLQSWNIGTSSNGWFAYQWHSDFNVADNVPPSIEQVTPKCKTSQTTSPPNVFTQYPFYRTEILLLGTGDVVYTNVSQPAGKAMVISMDAVSTSSGADFDLFVSSTTTFPDNTNYQWAGQSSSSSEAILIPSSSTSRTLNLAIHSHSGRGHVIVTPTVPRFNSANICVTDGSLTGHPTLNSGQVTTVKQYLKAGAAYFYGFTNGMIFRNSYSLNTTWTGTCNTEQTNSNNCDICIVVDSGSTSYGNPVSGRDCGHVDLHGSNWGGSVSGAWLYGHESAHSCFGLGDEYKRPANGDSSPRYCGHTTMNNSSKAWALCSMNHCQDGSLSDGSECSPSSASNWEILVASPLAAAYTGPQFGRTHTAYGTPYWDNVNFKELITFSGL